MKDEILSLRSNEIPQKDYAQALLDSVSLGYEEGDADMHLSNICSKIKIEESQDERSLVAPYNSSSGDQHG